MSRSIVLSNGEMCIALDTFGQVRDLYYPHVGLEDHVRGHYFHRVGVWADGRMSWLSDDPAWKIEISCDEQALVSSIIARNPSLEIELAFRDTVYNERPVFIREVVVTNKSARTREIKLYFGHQFEIARSHGSDTAYFDPFTHAIIHYKGRRVFLIKATLDGEQFSDYATGRSNYLNQEGTHRDADDGQLSRNPIEYGPADSVIGLYASYGGGTSRTAYYWMAAAKTIDEAKGLDQYVALKTPAHMIKTTTNFWHAWSNATPRNFTGLDPEQIALFKRSLLYVRAHVDVGGGIIASCDSDMLQTGLDTYSYVWPRDAAYTAIALDSAGDTNVAKRFFEFCRDTLAPEGYFMHKYLPDKSLGSSWHPWIKDGKTQLPIQEDETALVLWALKQHYTQSRDLEFLEDMFNPLVEKAANFLLAYREDDTKLPQPSYDIWERKRGTSTFTSSAVFGALSAAAELSHLLGKASHEESYRAAAEEVREGILKYLWDDGLGMFAKMMIKDESGVTFDRSVDMSSVFGVFSFGVLQADDPRLDRAFSNTVRTLSYGIASGGFARFENDDYSHVSGPSVGNPWVITTLWYAQYLTARAKSDTDLARVRDIFSWVAKHAQLSGVLSEQLNPQSGWQVGAAPLTWSHSEYVSAVLAYLEKVRALGIDSPESRK